MSTPLATGNGTIGGGGLTYAYTTFELTAAVGSGLIGAPDIDISLSGQAMRARAGAGTIGAGDAILAFQDWSAELGAGAGTIGAGNTQLRDIVRALFPALSPSDRGFEPPEYAISKYKTINGSKSRRLWASQPGGGTLDLLFENIDDDDAESILAAHDVAKGATNDVILPDEVLSGVEGDLLAYMRAPGGQAWSFDAEPDLESVKEGMSTVRVKLSGRRKVHFNSVGSVGGTFAVGAAPVDEIDPGGYGGCDLIGVGEDLSFIVYTQSHDWGINAVATNAGMTNGVFAEASETGFEFFDPLGDSPQWLQMDLVSVQAITSVVIGCDFNNTLTRGEGAWGKGGTEFLDVMYSTDGTTWTFAFNTGAFTQGIQTYSVDFSARFIRIMSKLVDFSGFTFQILAVTEFYAT